MRYSARSLSSLVTASVLTASVAFSPSALAGERISRAAVDPLIPVEELRLLIKPLTKVEIQVVAGVWIDILKDKVTEIGLGELQVKRANRAIAEAEQAADDAEPAGTGQEEVEEAAAEALVAEAAAEAQTEAKHQTLETLNVLREEQAAITDRVNVVLDGLEAKGGDATEHRAYVDAVTDIVPTVDVTDVSATWVALRGWVLSKEGGMRWGKNLALFALTLIVFAVLGSLARRATRRAMSLARAQSDLLKDFLSRIVGRIVFFIGLIVALSMLEVPIAPFLAAIGGAALVIGLALQGALSNVASGVMILLHRPFDVGEVIKAAGISGTVERMSILSTEVRTFDNQKMVVPNNAIWGDVITNVTGLPTRRVDMVFGIGYADDMAKAQCVLEDILSQHELVLDDPAPTIRVHELADSSVNFVVRPWSKTADYWTVYWDVTRTVKERFDAEGVSIPFPQRDVHVHQAPSEA